MTTSTAAVRAEGLILRGLNSRLLEGNGVVTRIVRDEMFLEGEAEGIDNRTWCAALEALILEGKILPYKINDLPGTLPLTSYSQTGYTVPAHLIDLLLKARGDQAEEIREYLEFHGVEVPGPMAGRPRTPRVAVTAAQKKRIDSAIRSLNAVRAEVDARNPDKRVTWYLDASGNFCLMIEPDGQMEMNQSDIAHEAVLQASGAGDW